LNPFRKRQEKFSKNIVNNTLNLVFDNEIISKFNDLQNMDVPLDLSAVSITKMGARAILGMPSDEVLGCTPEEMLTKKTQKLIELDHALAIAASELNEIHSARAVYAEDEVIIEYHIEMLEKIVERMKILLRNESPKS